MRSDLPVVSSCAAWLTRDKPNAAGRLGLFRVFFSLFYLWRLSLFHLTELDDVVVPWRPPALLDWVPRPPSFGLLECALAAVLTLQLFGLGTRIVTGAVLVLGIWFDVCRMSLTGTGLAMFLLVFWVPIVAVWSEWGATYSIDNVLRGPSGGRIAPDDPSGRFFWPVRTLLVCCAALYLTAGIAKMRGSWFDDPHYLRDFLLSKGITSHLANGAPLNPLNPLIAASGTLSVLMQYGGLLLEAMFPLAVFSPRARRVIFRVIPLFHASNMFLFGIPVVEILAVYIAFPDWHMLLRRFFGEVPERCAAIARGNPRGLVVAGICIAVLIGLSWNSSWSPRALLSGGGCFAVTGCGSWPL